MPKHHEAQMHHSNPITASTLAAIAVVMLMTAPVCAQNPSAFQRVPELSYRVLPDFFHFPEGSGSGESSAVALNSKGHIFLFQRVDPMLSEFDPEGRFIRSIGKGLFDQPHGLRIDAEDNIWTTDVGSHLVLKLSPAGRVLMVLGRKDWGAEANWLFNKPTDIALGKNGDIYVSDGYGNSRVVKFDKDGNFIKSWGSFGVAPGQFDLPHSIVIDNQGRVYVADRENQRIQIFDADGNFLKEWTGIGYPYGLYITPDQHIWESDGGYDRVLELDTNGKILGAIGRPGHMPGQFAWAHMLAVGPDRRIYVADVLNWRFQVFTPTTSTGKMAEYIPSVRMFYDAIPSTGYISRQKNRPTK